MKAEIERTLREATYAAEEDGERRYVVFSCENNRYAVLSNAPTPRKTHWMCLPNAEVFFNAGGALEYEYEKLLPQRSEQ